MILTLVGNRAEWAITMLACFRQGYVVLPCTEQLRPKDLALRLQVAQPRLVVADVRNAETLHAAGWSGDTLWVPFEDAPASAPPPPAELAPQDPCLITFTSGTSGEPKAVLHGQRYLTGQRLQAEHWLAPDPATSSGARPPRAGASRPATRSSRPGCAARPRCCTTRASTRRSASS